MDPVPLYNLDLGKTHPGKRFGNVRVGPFVVKVVDDYETQVGKIPHTGSRTDSFDTETGKPTTTFREASGSGWHVTAIATPDEGTDERSILCKPPADDGGAWDLCTILTFLTGRRAAKNCLCGRRWAGLARQKSWLEPPFIWLPMLLRLLPDRLSLWMGDFWPAV